MVAIHKEVTSFPSRLMQWIYMCHVTWVMNTYMSICVCMNIYIKSRLNVAKQEYLKEIPHVSPVSKFWIKKCEVIVESVPVVSEPGFAFAFQAAVWWNSQGLRKRCGPVSWKQPWGYGHGQCQIHITLAGTCSVPFIPYRLSEVNHPLLSSDSNSRSAIWFGFQKEYLVFLFGELILMESLCQVS